MSLTEFFAMGGYAFYVWSAYGITLVVLVANIVIPVFQRKQLIKQLVRKRQQ